MPVASGDGRFMKKAEQEGRFCNKRCRDKYLLKDLQKYASVRIDLRVVSSEKVWELAHLRHVPQRAARFMADLYLAFSLATVKDLFNRFNLAEELSSYLEAGFVDVDMQSFDSRKLALEVFSLLYYLANLVQRKQGMNIVREIPRPQRENSVVAATAWRLVEIASNRNEIQCRAQHHTRAQSHTISVLVKETEGLLEFSNLFFRKLVRHG